jgi:hypothetical protein
MAKVILSGRIKVKLKGFWGFYSGGLKNGFRSPISYFLNLFCSFGILLLLLVSNSSTYTYNRNTSK